MASLELDALRGIAQISAQLIEYSSLFRLLRSKKKAVTLRQEQLELLKSLTEAGIDPQLFDLLLSTELDRNLKKRFGIAFFVATIFFTLLSFWIIVANSMWKWGISDVAITGLIIETPLQFIGLLYIIARNLFPQPISGTLLTPRKRPMTRKREQQQQP
jgi:hypothetical protein